MSKDSKPCENHVDKVHKDVCEFCDSDLSDKNEKSEKFYKDDGDLRPFMSYSPYQEFAGRGWIPGIFQ
jgi:hypothetical protein